MVTLEYRAADGQTRSVCIDTATVLGAHGDSPLPLPPGAGKRALRIAPEADGSFSITDLASQSGVFVNGERVVRYGPLRAEDRIAIGGATVRVTALGQPPVKQPSPPKPQAAPLLNAQPLDMGHRSALALGAAAPAVHPAALHGTFGASAVASQEPVRPDPVSEAARVRRDALAHNAELLHAELIKTLDLRRQDVTRMADGELRVLARKLIDELMANLPRDPACDPEELAQFVLNEAVGLGVLESLLADDSVTEIMVNGAQDIFIERAGRSARSEIAFSSEKALMGVIERIVSPIGRRVDESSPLCDARLKDGSRVNIVIRPIALKGPTISIRKFAKRRLQVEDLVAAGSLDANMVGFLQMCVEHKKNIVISGGTGSGKTTLLNVVSNLIPAHERIVTIEDAAELKLYHDNLVTLEARPPNVEGRGQVSIRELVKNALRMRPDRIVVGECRGGEALDMLQAMNTGHDGSLTTAHANSPRDMLSRLEVMVLMAGMDLPVAAIREQIASAVHIVVQQTRFACGSRKVTSITEITGMEAGVIQMQEIFRFQRQGFDEHGRVRGQFMATGYVPTFYEELREHGVDVDLSLFDPDHGKGEGVSHG